MKRLIFLVLLACAFPLAMHAMDQHFYISFATRILIYAMAAASLNLAQSGVKFPGNQVTAHAAYLRANREHIKRFMMASIAGLAKIKSDRQFTTRVLEKYLRISDPRLLSEAYDFWVGVYSPKFYADPEEIETYFALSNIKAKPQDFVDNSILAELEREGFFDQVNKQYGLR